LAFADKLRNHPSKKLTVKQRYFENETHGTVAALSWYYGLRKLLQQSVVIENR